MSTPDPQWTRLWVSGLQLESSGREGITALSQSLESSEKRNQWVLLNPARKVQVSGEGFPEIDRVEKAIREEVGSLPWDVLEAITRDNPDHGEARLAMAEFALALSAPSRFRNSRPMASYEVLLPQARAALEKLLSLPEWPWQVDLAVETVPGPPRAVPGAPEVDSKDLQQEKAKGVSKAASPQPQPQTAGALPIGGSGIGLEASRFGRLGPLLRGQAPSLQEILRRMAEEVLAALASDPNHPCLQANLAFLLRILDRDGAEWLMSELSSVTPLPGQAWPPLSLIHAQSDALRHGGRWAELLNQVQVWSRKADRLFLDPLAWDRHLFREGTLLAYAAMARSWREGPEILPEALSELRRQTGSYFPELARLTLRWAHLPEAPSKDREELFRLMALSTLPAPAMPSPIPPWRLEVRESKDLSRLKEAFDRAPSLVQWLPSERLLVQQSTQSRPWAVFLGADDKGGGDNLPIPEALSDILAAGRPGRLYVASDRVAREPDAMGPRRLRIAFLLQRMPCRAIESLLAGDLSRALLGADLKVEDLDENLWFTEARRAIPALEEHLRRWPLDGDRWVALAFWTSFVPAHRGPADLAGDLPSFQPDLPFLLCLPASIHAQVGDQLRRRKAWAPLRAWCEPAWKRLLEMDPETPRGRVLVHEFAPTIQSLLDAAYAGLGLSAQRRLLQESGRVSASPRGRIQ